MSSKKPMPSSVSLTFPLPSESYKKACDFIARPEGRKQRRQNQNTGVNPQGLWFFFEREGAGGTGGDALIGGVFQAFGN